MGGSPSTPSPNPANYIPRPNNDLAILQLSNQEKAGETALLNQSKMLELTSALPKQAYTPDIYSPVGQLQQANKVSSINAYNSQKLEQEQNPAAAATRSALNTSAAQGVAPDYWQNTMSQYGNQTGLTK